MLMIHKWNGYVNNISKVTYLYTNACGNKVIGLQMFFSLRLVMKANKKVNWNVLWTKCWRIYDIAMHQNFHPHFALNYLSILGL